MAEKPSILALIPARGGSKGIPRKNIRSLAGKPLLAYSCECALASNLITRTIVSTDCPRIAEVARQHHVEVPFMRPPELARDDSPTSDVIRHLLNWIKDREEVQPEVVVLLQPTAPLRCSQDVDQAIRELLATNADSVVSVCAVSQHFHPEWQFDVRDGWLQPYSAADFGQIPTRRQMLRSTFVRNGAIYAFRSQALQFTGSFYGRRCRAFQMPVERSVNIDTLQDWHRAEAYLTQPKPRHAA